MKAWHLTDREGKCLQAGGLSKAVAFASLNLKRQVALHIDFVPAAGVQAALAQEGGQQGRGRPGANVPVCQPLRLPLHFKNLLEQSEHSHRSVFHLGDSPTTFCCWSYRSSGRRPLPTLRRSSSIHWAAHQKRPVAPSLSNSPNIFARCGCTAFGKGLNAHLPH